MDGRKIIGHKWEVEVDEEKLVTLGSIKISSTKVILRCEEEHLEEMIKAFRLRFLSAGG